MKRVFFVTQHARTCHQCVGAQRCKGRGVESCCKIISPTPPCVAFHLQLLHLVNFCLKSQNKRLLYLQLLLRKLALPLSCLVLVKTVKFFPFVLSLPNLLPELCLRCNDLLRVIASRDARFATVRVLL